MTAVNGIAVSDEPERSRYAACVDGEVAGYAEYVLGDRRITFTHTEVVDRFEGQGVGGRLAAAALADARATRLRVEPRCAFIAGYIARHPTYQHLFETSGAS